MTAITSERLYPVLRLSMLALRPEEVCGLRKSDFDLDAGMLSISNARTMVKGKVIEKSTKTASGTRELPLDPATVAAWKRFFAVQAAERLAAGEGYDDRGYACVDELGRPLATWQLRRLFLRLAGKAGLRRVTLYQARHSCLSWLANSGELPIAIVAAWAGHSDPAVTLRHYVKVQPDDLRQAAAALTRLLG